MEFLLNPIFGKLSDTFGRRAIIPLGCYMSVICRALVRGPRLEHVVALVGNPLC